MEKLFPLPDEMGAVKEAAEHGSPLFMVIFICCFWLPYQRLLGMAKSGAIVKYKVHRCSLLLIRRMEQEQGGSADSSDEVFTTVLPRCGFRASPHPVPFRQRSFLRSNAAVSRSVPHSEMAGRCRVNADVGHGKP